MAKMQVAKITLSTGKIVYLREIEIADTERAAEMVAQRAGDNQQLMSLFMQKALLQLVLVQIGDEKVSAIERENVNNLFKMAEYTQLLRVIQKMSGGDDLGKEAKLELVSQEKTE